MLVLSREINTGIVLQLPTGETVDVMVVDVRDDGHSKQVRLGFEAPRQVAILRAEVAETEAANREAAQTPAAAVAAIAGLTGLLRGANGTAPTPASALKRRTS
jgi:carbon storage regulator CsrA